MSENGIEFVKKYNYLLTSKKLRSDRSHRRKVTRSSLEIKNSFFNSCIYADFDYTIFS